jgi:hypothetical protein
MRIFGKINMHNAAFGANHAENHINFTMMKFQPMHRRRRSRCLAMHGGGGASDPPAAYVEQRKVVNDPEGMSSIRVTTAEKSHETSMKSMA